MGTPLFDQPAKQVADTSIAVYREVVQPTLSAREALVLAALRRFLTAPTAYELATAMIARQEIHDINGCRPRLTELYKRGVVVRGEKRRCRVTGCTSYTWTAKE